MTQAEVEPVATSLGEKIALLALPATHASRVPVVEIVETHMSLLFVAGDLVYKLKKPVVYPFLDFSTLSARERSCRDELRLNRRLAADVYLGLSTMTREADGTLALDGHGQIVEWLVRMRRLPRDRMLDVRIREGSVTPQEVDATAAILARFYATAAAAQITADEYLQQLRREHAVNRAIIATLGGGPENALVTEVARFLDHDDALLRERVEAARIVDGHGDLRPEHVCLETPPVIIDCLEFNEQLRQVDPFDEIAYLGLECTRLGASWIASRLLARLCAGLGETVDPRLLVFYARYRACVRARLALAHLAEASPRDPARWQPLAREYLRIGARFNPVPSAP